MACAFASACMAADAPEDMLKEAQQLERAGSVKKAAGIYENFIKSYPDHSQATDANYNLAKCYDSMGMVDEAVARLKKVLESDSKQFRNKPDAYYMLGKFYASLKDYDNAIATFEKMLAGGPGLYEDEVLNLCGGYYAIREKYDEAAAKLNILKRKTDSKYAEQAGYKLATLWIKAGKLDRAMDAVQEFVQQYPASKQIPELLLRAADLQRTQKKYDKTIALCEQLTSGYPKTIEALAATYLLGLTHRDRKEYQKAADVFDRVGNVKEYQGRGLAAEALLQGADLYFAELADMPKAIARYSDAARLARDSDSDRKTAIMEQCYFRIAEYYYQQKNWSTALENYLLLRATGTKLNILGRILQCQSELGNNQPDQKVSDAEAKIILEKIKANPGSVMAAEGEIFLADRKLTDSIQRKAGFGDVVKDYQKILDGYSKDVLSQSHMESYVHMQIGTACAHSTASNDWPNAVKAFQKAVDIDPADSNPYKVMSLESLALVAGRLSDKPTELAAYSKLLSMSKQKMDQNKEDKGAEKKTLDYLKSLVTRSDTKDMIQASLDMCRALIEEKGQLSELSREARFYIGELYYVAKDFPAAAKAFQEYMRIYGPKQDDSGEVLGAPWKPGAVDGKVLQVYNAALRIAHAWYMQGHDQNMVKAYGWIARNMPEGNPYMPEVKYWLALETTKGKQIETKEGKLRAAQSLWTNVVNSCANPADPKLPNSYYPWVKDGRYEQSLKYVKTAMLKAGRYFGEADGHEAAARVFEEYLAMFPPQQQRPGEPRQRDEMNDIARYALGREYAALGNVRKMITCYNSYLDDLRDSPFRVSALKLVGYHAGKDGQYGPASDAYAALLDEYGVNKLDAKDKPIPVPQGERLRQARGWDGIRMPVPKDLDQGEIRFALGFLYWKQDDWNRCIAALAPFQNDPALAKNKSRDRALYMSGQSRYKVYDYTNGVKTLTALIKEHPRFEAIDEVYVQTADGYAQTKAWQDLDAICRKFIAEKPASDKRSWMDLYAALATIGTGKTAKGVGDLKAIAESDTFEDVKAAALYHAGLSTLAANPKNVQEASKYFDKSVNMFPRANSCLEAAKCQMALGNWTKANALLDKIARDFPKGDPVVVEEAKRLSPQVLKELAKQQEKKGGLK